MKGLKLTSFGLKSFKAVRDSGVVKLTPLTALIGNNGSGKSSFIEGLETLQSIVNEGLDWAMQQWRGYEHIRHLGIPRRMRSGKLEPERPFQPNPMSFTLRGEMPGDIKHFAAMMDVSVSPNGDELFITQEEIVFRNWFKYSRDAIGRTEAHALQPNHTLLSSSSKIYPLSIKSTDGRANLRISEQLPDDVSLLEECLDWYISPWQFISLDPYKMGQPIPQQRTGGPIRLNQST